jgi:thymidylate kinase/thymidylate synthase ThyX
MTTGHGIFIAIEGTDGSGKGTQSKRLAARLSGAGYEVATFDFPQYDLPSSYFVQQYLNGGYGTAEAVGPYAASLFYALDRFEAAPKIREALSQGKIVLANRFVGSNMAHQGTKFQHAEERRGFFIWLDNLEFEMLRVPRPALSFVLRVPAEQAQALVDQKGRRSYTNKKRDIHEADLSHLKKSVEVYDDMCQLFPNDFVRIDCTRDNQLLDIGTVHEILWQKVTPLLPPKRSKKKAPAAASSPAKVTTESPYVRKTAAGYEITAEGKKLLGDTVTAPDGNIYAFSQKLSHTAVVSAMMRLSLAGETSDASLLQAMAGLLDDDSELQRHTIETYGERAWQKLTGSHTMLTQASTLLAGKIQQGRLAAYLDQSEHIGYEQKDGAGDYRYCTPDHFDPNLRDQYRSYMDQIFNLHAEIVEGLTAHIAHSAGAPKSRQDPAWSNSAKNTARVSARPVLPLAAKVSLGVYSTSEALEVLITRLMSDPLPEAREAGESMLAQARKIMPAFAERIATPERGGAAISYLATTNKKVERLARAHLPDHYSNPSPAVELVTAWPRNELDLVPEMLYKHSALPLRTLQGEAAGWAYDKKVSVFETYLGERSNSNQLPGRALEKAHYSWDVVCDYNAFRELQKQHILDAIERQTLTPRYGYEVPKVIEEAELTDQFEACFDLSLRLYSILQEAGFVHEAEYAVLQGHKLRAKLTYNARQAFRITASTLSSPQRSSESYRTLANAMHEKISEVHPLLGEAMKRLDH